METIRIGSNGDSVKSLQLLLKQIGYNLSVDGIFGNNTEDIVMSFQNKNHLTDDGIVGKLTWDCLFRLTSGNIDNKIINDTRYVLTTKNYYNVPQKKQAITLHHTNGWTVKKGTEDSPSMNHFYWWTSQNLHVSTPFSIDYKGNIFQHFDPQCWAYHLGLGNDYVNIDKTSIGIELTNEGFLKKKENDKFVWFSGKIEIPYNRPNDKPIYVKEGWRGYNWFAPYSKEQIDSTLWLVKYLSKKYNIKLNFIDDCEYHEEILSGAFEGIFSHSNVRPYPSKRNKWDLSPAFPYKEFKNRL